MRYCLALVFLLMMVLSAWAEPFPFSYTEPVGQAGTLARTCVRFAWCKDAPTACTSDVEMAKVCTAGTNGGNGGSVINGTVIIPIYEGDLPVTVNYCVNSVNTDGNESLRWSVCGTNHTFTAP